MRKLWIVFLGCFLLCTPLAASSFMAMSQEELIAESSAVVQGKVVETRSYWNKDRTLIWTEAVIEVEERLVGETPGLVRVQTPGGMIGDFRIEAVGFPIFEANQRLLVFLKPEGKRTRVTGFRQGQWHIERDDSGREIAVPTVDGDVLLIDRGGRKTPPPRPMHLDTLKDNIRQAATRLGMAGK